MVISKVSPAVPVAAHPKAAPPASPPMAANLAHHLSTESKLRQASMLKISSSRLSKDPLLLSLAAGLPSPTLFPIESVTTSVVLPISEAERVSGKWFHDGLQAGVLKDVGKAKNSKALGVTAYDLSQALQYEQGTGAKQLVEFWKEHVELVHKPKYADWNTIMSGGNTQAMETVFRMLINPGDYMVLEEFAFPETVDSLRPLQTRRIGIPVDEEGMRPDVLEDMLATWDEDARGGTRPHVLYMVPSGQNPTGATIGTERRKKIYDIAQRYDLIIIEDDPYYFLQMPDYIRDRDYEHVPVPTTNAEFLSALVPSMLSLDTDGRVVRLDSLAKIVAPGTRCGFITANSVFAERILRHNEVGLQFPSGLSMAVVHGLLADAWGQETFLNWLVNIRAEYTVRRDRMLDAMEDYLPKEVASWAAPSAGMFVWIELAYPAHPHSADLCIEEIENEIFEAGIANKVLILPGTWFKTTDVPSRGIFFRATYAAVSPENIDLAIKRFGEVVQRSFGLV
ncbi:pyridoxal phosphate-dependent transferase [Limtongia smithiae]|uniref:pyridoxal phosphate-dependent transferase n=1 Tax=Limtongia smithiae TaxID=1125753 RepID=UPI0034CD69D6